jgi:parallel beta-helix repeat protein
VATNLFVRASAGNDSNDGRSPSAALRTIQAAADRAMPGIEIIVGPGTYLGQVQFRAPGGDPSRPIKLTANPAGDLTGDNPGDVLIDANRLGRGVFIDAAPYIIVDGFRITNSSAPAVEIRRESDGAEIRNSEIFNNAEDGIRVQDSDNVVLFNNLIYCNLRRGILIGGALGGSNRARVVNNTVVQNADRGMFIGNSDAASVDAFLRNNIIQNNGTAELQVVTQERNSLDGFDANYNMVFDETGQSGQYVGPTPGPNDLVVPAGFADIAMCEPLNLHDEDYRLLPQSPAVNTADPATAPGFSTPLLQRTTSTDNALDAAPLDLGYHFAP